MNSRIAIITARGGSKRIPKKNIKMFCGQPIIAYSIQAALRSGLFNEVMVSTDSEEIAEIARRYGAKVPFMRSAETSNDHAITADVILEVLEQYRKQGMVFNTTVCIYPTAPFVTDMRLHEGIELLEKSGDEVYEVKPVVQFSFPPQRGFVRDQGLLRMPYPENYTKRSQDLEPIYHDAGQFYCWKTDAYIQKKGIIREGIAPLVLSELEVQDIDNETDWKLAELKYQLLHKDITESQG